MNITPAKIASNIELKEPKLFGLPNSFMPLYSNEDDTTEEKKNNKDSKPKENLNSFYGVITISNEKKNISSKLNININNDDIMQELKLLGTSPSNGILSENYPNCKNLIFSCRKRNDDDNIDTQLVVSIPREENKDGGQIKNKKPAYKKHDKMEKDNIVRKIQVHYCNFLVCLINEVIKRIIIEESYQTENAETITHMKDYLLNTIDYRFKSNIRKDFMQITENMKIKDIISPSADFCNKYNLINKNKDIMNKIELKNHPILNNILNQKYLFYFNDIYYQNKRKFNLSEGNMTLSIVLSNNTKTFDDLVLKNMDDKNYILKLKRVVMQNFSKPKFVFKIKK